MRDIKWIAPFTEEARLKLWFFIEEIIPSELDKACYLVAVRNPSRYEHLTNLHSDLVWIQLHFNISGTEIVSHCRFPKCGLWVSEYLRAATEQTRYSIETEWRSVLEEARCG